MYRYNNTKIYSKPAPKHADVAIKNLTNCHLHVMPNRSYLTSCSADVLTEVYFNHLPQ